MSLQEKRDIELKMLELNMSVKYIKDARFHHITLGNTYSVYEVTTDRDIILIKDDTGKLSYYSLHWFEMVAQPAQITAQ